MARSHAVVGGVAMLWLTFCAPAGGQMLDIVPQFGPGVDTARQQAVEHAISLWEGWLVSTLPGDTTLELSVDFETFSSANTLGSASYDWLGYENGYALTPAQVLLAGGRDERSNDGTIRLNIDYDWYTGTDARPGSGQIDLVTVVLHEIGHQLGIVSSYHSSGSSTIWGYRERPSSPSYLTVWDSYLRDGQGDAPQPYPAGEDFDETGEVVFAGPSAAAVLGQDVPVYAPSPYSAGSSLSHADPSVGYGLMRPTLPIGASQHGLGDYEAGIYTDLGWQIATPAEAHARGFGSRRWHDGAAWQSGLVPDGSQSVSLGASTDAYTITVRRAASATTISVSGSALLQVDGASVSGGSITLTDGELELRNDGSAEAAEIDNLAGTLRGQGTLVGQVANDGWIAPGLTTPGQEIGQLTVVGNLTQSAGGAMSFDLDTPTAYDRILGRDGSDTPAGTFTLAGAIEVDWLPTSFAYQPEALLELISAGSVLGAFDSELLPTFATGDPAAMLLYEPDAVVLRLLALPGDANGDLLVDDADYTLWADNYNQPGLWSTGDFNDDGFVDDADYTVWADRYQQHAFAAPEPVTLLLLGFASAGVLQRRRR